MSNFKKIEEMDDFSITSKLICVGADGALVMQWSQRGQCVRLQITIAPYVTSIHFLTHKLNIANKSLSIYDHV